MLNKAVSGLSSIKLTRRLVALCALSALVLIVPLVACGLPSQTSTSIEAASSAPIVLQATELVIDPVVVKPGDGILITAQVTNNGDNVGDYTVQLVINDIVEDTKRVIIPAGETYTLKFTGVKTIAGAYSVNLDNLTGQFLVVEPTEPVPPSSPDIIEADSETSSCCGGSSGNPESDTSSGCGCGGSPINTEQEPEQKVSSGCGCGG
ncbi:hypothetical protein ACFLUH_03480 [Chloroflexota bacterium]